MRTQCRGRGPVARAAAGAATEDTEIYGVPIDREDPVRGPNDALVTLVVFSDFECPFCRRLEPTLSALMQKYGEDLRIVWKDYPLPFHRQAIPAAVLARLALGERGAYGFWEAHDALMQSGQGLDEATLQAVARRMGLPWSEVGTAVADRRFQAIFDRGQELAGKLRVRGTPCTFVNGRRVEGAVPVEAFVSVIDAQLAKARDLLEAGQERAGLYAAVTNTPLPQQELERRSVDPPTKDNPSRGAAKARVTLQVFGDFECPNSLRLMPMLAEVEKKFSGRVRLVWRNHPLVFHEDAALAAEAAQEVFVQKGAASFWRYHELLYAAQLDGGLGRPNLEKRWTASQSSNRRVRCSATSAPSTGSTARRAAVRRAPRSRDRRPRCRSRTAHRPARCSRSTRGTPVGDGIVELAGARGATRRSTAGGDHARPAARGGAAPTWRRARRGPSQSCSRRHPDPGSASSFTKSYSTASTRRPADLDVPLAAHGASFRSRASSSDTSE